MPRLLEEAGGEPLRAGIVEHAPRLGRDTLGGVELTRLGGVEERLVGDRIPEEEGKAARHLVAVEAAHVAAGDLDADRGNVEEARRLKERREHVAHPHVEHVGVVTGRADDPGEAGDLVVVEGAAEEEAAVVRDDVGDARVRGRGRRASGEDREGVATRHDLPGDVHGGLGVLLDAARRGRDRGRADGGEARRPLVLLEVGGRRDPVAEDVAERGFVLHAGQAPHRHRGGGEGAEGILRIANGGTARVPGRGARLGAGIADEPVARGHGEEEERREPGSDDSHGVPHQQGMCPEVRPPNFPCDPSLLGAGHTGCPGTRHVRCPGIGRGVSR